MSRLLARLSPWPLWLLLSLPALGMAWQLATATDPDTAAQLLHPTGEFAARFLIVSLLASPLVLLFPRAGLPRWLRANRRYFGVAAFGYGLVHTVLYLLDAGALAGRFDQVLAEAPQLAIWTGWAAFAIFLPLAATSFDAAVRAMGPAWKRLQRWAYAAAVLTLVHWAALHDWGGVAPALVHFAPLAALEGYRLWYWTLRPRHRVA